MIGDPQLKVAKLYDMLPDEAGDTSEGRTAADNAPVRAVFFIGPDKRVKAMLTYPMTSGCNFDEVLRLLDSLQLTAAHPVATPVNWRQGDDVIIVTSVSDEQARKKFPGGWKTLKPYVRIVCRRRFFSSKRWAWKRSGEAFPGLLANCSLSELLEECQISSAEALSEPVIDWREKLVRVFCPTPTVPRRARQAPAPRRSRRGPLSAGPAYVPSPAAKRSPAR